MNKHIHSSADLVTTYVAKRSGFLEIALRKNREALPYIDEAKSLRAIVDLYSNPTDMAKDPRTKGPLAEAAGISTKASNYIGQEDINIIVLEFIKNFLEPAGDQFGDEMVYRFLLTKGDALGGRMRNIVGVMASEKVTRFLTANLRNCKIDHFLLLINQPTWHKSDQVTQDNLSSVKAIRWKNSKGQNREIFYNIKVPVVTKNIDISVFNSNIPSTTNKTLMRSFFTNPGNYLALGELKGGIDPAGADEHWKTASTALQRIRTSFATAGNPVETFFVGGAIEVSMAEEIYDQVSEKKLSMAANLTNDKQLAELCAWIIDL